MLLPGVAEVPTSRRQARRARRYAAAVDARPTLSRARVVSEALALVDEAGLDGCSIRALSARLGVTPMALYTHVIGKDDLFDAVLDAVLATISREGLPADPVEALVTVGHRYRSAFAAHPRAAPLLATRPTPQGPIALQLMADTIAMLQLAGLDDRQAASAYALLAQFVMGTVLAEHESDERLPPLLEGLGMEGIPDRDERFEFGLVVLASGIRAMVAG